MIEVDGRPEVGHDLAERAPVILDHHILGENRPSQKERIVFQPCIFRGLKAVSF